MECHLGFLNTWSTCLPNFGVILHYLDVPGSKKKVRISGLYPQSTPVISRWNNPLILTIDPDFLASSQGCTHLVQVLPSALRSATCQSSTVRRAVDPSDLGCRCILRTSDPRGSVKETEIVLDLLFFWWLSEVGLQHGKYVPVKGANEGL